MYDISSVVIVNVATTAYARPYLTPFYSAAVTFNAGELYCGFSTFSSDFSFSEMHIPMYRGVSLLVLMQPRDKQLVWNCNRKIYPCLVLIGNPLFSNRKRIANIFTISVIIQRS